MSESEVYVVTRNGRRIEDTNYSSGDKARSRAIALRALLKRWKDRDSSKVKVEKTHKPNRIR